MRDEPITYEALNARLLHRPELSEADLFPAALQGLQCDVHM